MTPPRGLSITDIRTVAVPVSDQDEALAFYRGLGLEVRLDVPFGPQRWIEVAPPGSLTTLALVPAEPDRPAGVDTGVRFTTTDADADHAALREQGVDVDAEVLRMGAVPPMFAFRDPDGNRLILVERAHRPSG